MAATSRFSAAWVSSHDCNMRRLRAVLEAIRGPKLRFEANAHNAPVVILPQN